MNKPLELIPLGRTGVKVSRLCFGAMSFGGDADEAASAALFARCRDAGINFFDCANVYSGGRAEEILGRLAAPCRDELVLTSKAYFPTGPDANARGSSRRHLVRAVEASLKRLQTDRIDLFFLHRFDDLTPLDETLRAVEDLVRSGKILYAGASNFAAWQVMKALGIASQRGYSPLVCLQPMYNLVKRQAEVELLPLAQAEGLGVISYSPLGGGLLSGKYGPGVKPPAARLTTHPMYKVRYGDDWMYEAASRFTAFAREHGYAPAALAVAWVAGHPAITAPIIGARNVAQLEESLQAAAILMTPDLRDALSALTPEPPPATDRNDERSASSMNAR
jgi:aryl-alcohol dehydrogenase-like predicted oxidoreductase